MPKLPDFSLRHLLLKKSPERDPKTGKEKPDLETYQKVEDVNAQIIHQLASPSAQHHLTLKELEESVTDHLHKLFSHLTKIPARYTTYSEAWTRISRIPPPKEDRPTLSTYTEEAKKTEHILRQASPALKQDQYYQYAPPRPHQHNKLASEMKAREDFRALILRVCRTGQVTPEPLDFSQMISPLSVALACDVTDVYESWKRDECTSDPVSRKEALKKALPSILKQANVSSENISKIMKIWGVQPLPFHMPTPSLPPNQRFSFAKRLDLKPSELLALVSACNLTLEGTKAAPITDNIIGSLSPKGLGLLHQRIQGYLDNISPLMFFENLETLEHTEPKEHPLFIPLFEKITSSLSTLSDEDVNGSHFILDPSAPNYRFLSEFFKFNKPFKTASDFKSSVLSKLSHHIQTLTIPTLLHNHTQWKEDAKDYHEITSAENYDLAYQLVYHTAEIIHKTLLDHKTKNAQWGSVSKPYVYRDQEDASLPPHLVHLLHELTRPLSTADQEAFKEAVFSLVRLTDNILLNQNGRSKNLGLHVQISPETYDFPKDKHGEFSGVFEPEPHNAKLILLAPELLRRSVEDVVNQFSTIPLSENPVVFLDKGLSHKTQILSKFLSTAMAVPEHMSPSLHGITLALCEKAFFLPSAGFYHNFMKACQAEAQFLLQETLGKLKPDQRNWLSFILNYFPAESVLKAFLKLREAYGAIDDENRGDHEPEDHAPYTKRLWRVFQTVLPVLHVLLSPAGSPFITSREDSSAFWADADQHYHFYITLQKFFDGVRDRLGKDARASLSLLLPYDILTNASARNHLQNKNLGFLSGLFSPAVTAVSGLLRQASFSEEIPQDRSSRHLLYVLLQCPHHLAQTSYFNTISRRLIEAYHLHVQNPSEPEPQSYSKLVTRTNFGLIYLDDLNFRERLGYALLQGSIIPSLLDLFNTEESDDTPSIEITSEKLEQFIGSPCPIPRPRYDYTTQVKSTAEYTPPRLSTKPRRFRQSIVFA